MHPRFELNDYPQERNEEAIRNTFLNASDYQKSRTGLRIIYNDHFDSLDQQGDFNYLTVIKDLQAENPECVFNGINDLVISSAYSGAWEQLVCSKNYLILGSNDPEKASSDLIKRLEYVF